MITEAPADALAPHDEAPEDKHAPDNPAAKLPASRRARPLPVAPEAAPDVDDGSKPLPAPRRTRTITEAPADTLAPHAKAPADEDTPANPATKLPA